MIKMTPSGALSPYYYKGGYFHGIHYGNYYDDEKGIMDMIDKEEEFILKSPEMRRIMIDIYKTELSDKVVKRFVEHINAIRPRIVKLAIATDKKGLHRLKHALKKAGVIELGICCFGTDMETDKTWLVSDEY